MPLINIPNQPIKFEPYDEPKACQKIEPYCFKNQYLDEINVQWKQDPSGGELICDPFFLGTGTELVTNGAFAADTDWTHGTFWVIAAGQACYDSGGAGNMGIQQLLAGVVTGHTYQITFTIQNYVANTLAILFTNDIIAGVTANGVYTFNAVASATNQLIRFETSDSFDGCITGVSVIEIAPCWTFDNGEVNFIGSPGGGICHNPGTVTTISQTTAPLTAPNYYKVQIVIKNRTTGDVTVTLGVTSPTSEAIITTNGINTVYLYAATTNDFTLTMSSDFDGCIMSVSVLELVGLTNPYQIDVVDSDGNIVASNITTFSGYDNEFITLVANLAALDIGGGTIPYGCYTIQITDPSIPKTYESNCINYQQEFPNTYLLVGNIQSDGTSDPKYGYGFKFNPFKLQQRLEFYFRNPKYPSSFNKEFYSTGQLYKSFVTSEKVFEMYFSPVSEVEHDVIRLQINCELFYFTDNNGAIQYYNNRTGEYSPESGSLGTLQVYPSRIEVQHRTDVLKLSNV